MPARTEKSALKRAAGDDAATSRKTRRSQRLSDQFGHNGLPSPVTNPNSSDVRRTESLSPTDKSDTQPLSQFITPIPFTYEVHDEKEEGVWGYLIPLDGAPDSTTLVLKRRSACIMPAKDPPKDPPKDPLGEEIEYEKKKIDQVPAGGYLIGRHPECDRIVNTPTVSNRHCLFFHENKLGSSIAVLEDLSGNGTYVNDLYVGRNKRRELNDGDEISILDVARYIFRYPRVHDANGFRQQYSIDTVLGKGHFATVYLCTEKNTGIKYAAKHFERRAHNVAEEKSKVDGLQQEVAVLMAVSHPNVLCLKDTFVERHGVYLILELAPEGELFNCIVTRHKLTEPESRKVFQQLFKGVKYLHERNIVHRDIKPENILLIDKELSTVKIADFGLAKIIGEESFTTTLCGTPSYVAPEILESGNRRRYTKAVDVWSLGVVLYICLCGFPPFSDELCTKENPYTLSQQIRAGRFDYPSPYWDSVGDSALDLIDRMLTVNVDKRITIDECLEHPWTTGTTGLSDALDSLDFSSRKIRRERTLLSEINQVYLERVVDAISKKDNHAKVKIFKKNAGPDKSPEPGTSIYQDATLNTAGQAASIVDG